jgi:hypothetical protein
LATALPDGESFSLLTVERYVPSINTGHVVDEAAGYAIHFRNRILLDLGSSDLSAYFTSFQSPSSVLSFEDIEETMRDGLSGNPGVTITAILPPAR